MTSPVRYTDEELIMKQQTVSGAVLVGLDGNEDSRRALRWALLEGQSTGRRLHLVHCQMVPGGNDGREHAEQGSRELLDDALELCRDYPDVQVTTEAIDSRGSSAAASLLEASAINVWHERGASGAGAVFPIEDRITSDADRHQGALDLALESWRRNFPDVPVIAENIVGHAASVLRDASEHAALLVVGRREKGGVGLLLGSVSQSVLHHAQCPVAVVG
jgi:nucleotide-binding universal stress UspA family protein